MVKSPAIQTVVMVRESEFQLYPNDAVPVTVDIVDLDKGGKVFNIRKDDKRIWLKTRNQTLHYGFSPNKFKPEKPDGSVVLYPLTDSWKKVVNVIETSIKEAFVGITLNNVKVTGSTIEREFKPTIDPQGQMRVTVSPNECAVFDVEKKLVETDAVARLTRSTAVDLIIEPTYLWYTRGKAMGITWTARQVWVNGQRTEEDEHEEASDTLVSDKQDPSHCERPCAGRAADRASEQGDTRPWSIFADDKPDLVEVRPKLKKIATNRSKVEKAPRSYTSQVTVSSPLRKSISSPSWSIFD